MIFKWLVDFAGFLFTSFFNFLPDFPTVDVIETTVAFFAELFWIVVAIQGLMFGAAAAEVLVALNLAIVYAWLIWMFVRRMPLFNLLGF